MKKVFLLFTLLCHVSYIENRDGVVRELKINPPWYFEGLPPLQETVLIELEGIPPLPLQRKFHLEKTESIWGETLTKYRVDLSVEAKEEVIPLNVEEAQINEILSLSGLQEVKLQGEGEIWLDSTQKLSVAEQFSLSGDIIQNGDKKHLQIEWAKGCEK